MGCLGQSHHRRNRLQNPFVYLCFILLLLSSLSPLFPHPPHHSPLPLQSTPPIAPFSALLSHSAVLLPLTFSQLSRIPSFLLALSLSQFPLLSHLFLLSAHLPSLSETVQLNTDSSQCKDDFLRFPSMILCAFL